MKDIEQYIFEQEYQENFIFEESFWRWLSRLGKKFWKWLTERDFDSENVDWSVGKAKKVKWVDADDRFVKKMKKDKGLQINFEQTSKIIERLDSKNIKYVITPALNHKGTPICQIIGITDVNFIFDFLRKKAKVKKYDEIKNKLQQVEKIILIYSIEKATKNEEDDEYFFEDHIKNAIDENYVKNYDIVIFNFSNDNFLKPYTREIINEYDMNMTFPILDGRVEWDNIGKEDNKEDKEKSGENKDNKDKQDEQNKDNNKEDDNNTTEIPDKEDGKINIEPKDKKPKNKKVPNNIIEFINDKTDEIIASAEFSGDYETVKEVTKLNINKNDFYNFVITKLDINDKYDPEEWVSLIDDFILPVICDKLRQYIEEKVDETKSIKIYIKLNDEAYKEHIKKLRTLSMVKKTKIKESINNVFIIIGKTSKDMVAKSKELEKKAEEKQTEEKQTNESLDIDNIFWMLDTWFTNNEQERSTFMSIIDNCIIKKTYNKNDLMKLCETINFDIRPFINFMSKDAVVDDTKKDEDHNLDYYYELKKIIDVLISNKSTSNKYVRFS